MTAPDNQEWITSDYADEDRGVVKPPFWPIILQLLLLIVSTLLFFLPPVEKHLLFGLIAYVFTPFLVVALLAVIRASDLKNRALSNYDRALGKKYQAIAGFLSLASFITALPLIWRIAIEIAQEWAAH